MSNLEDVRYIAKKQSICGKQFFAGPCGFGEYNSVRDVTVCTDHYEVVECQNRMIDPEQSAEEQ